MSAFAYPYVGFKCGLKVTPPSWFPIWFPLVPNLYSSLLCISLNVHLFCVFFWVNVDATYIYFWKLTPVASFSPLCLPWQIALQSIQWDSAWTMCQTCIDTSFVHFVCDTCIDTSFVSHLSKIYMQSFGGFQLLSKLTDEIYMFIEFSSRSQFQFARR